MTESPNDAADVTVRATNRPDADGGGADKALQPGVNAGASANVGDDAVARFCDVFERSAKRWEMMIYPTMILLVLLGAYGFYQVINLSHDMRTVAQRLDPQMGRNMAKLTASMQELAINIQAMSTNINDMSGRVASMADDTRAIAAKMDHLRTMDSLEGQMKLMNRSMAAMTAHTNVMRWSIANMNRSVSKPMRFMSGFMPW